MIHLPLWVSLFDSGFTPDAHIASGCFPSCGLPYTDGWSHLFLYSRNRECHAEETRSCLILQTSVFVSSYRDKVPDQTNSQKGLFLLTVGGSNPPGGDVTATGVQSSCSHGTAVRKQGAVNAGTQCIVSFLKKNFKNLFSFFF